MIYIYIDISIWYIWDSGADLGFLQSWDSWIFPCRTFGMRRSVTKTTSNARNPNMSRSRNTNSKITDVRPYLGRLFDFNRFLNCLHKDINWWWWWWWWWWWRWRYRCNWCCCYCSCWNIKKDGRRSVKFETCVILRVWPPRVWPPPSNSDHQDTMTFSAADPELSLHFPLGGSNTEFSWQTLIPCLAEKKTDIAYI